MWDEYFPESLKAAREGRELTDVSNVIPGNWQ